MFSNKDPISDGKDPETATQASFEDSGNPQPTVQSMSEKPNTPPIVADPFESSPECDVNQHADSYLLQR